MATELDGLQPDQSSDHKNHKNHNDKRMIKITACDTNPELILAKPLRFFKVSEITSSFYIGIILLFTNCLVLRLDASGLLGASSDSLCLSMPLLSMLL